MKKNRAYSKTINLIIFLLIGITSQAQTSKDFRFDWKYKMDYKSDELTFIGNHQEKVFFLKKAKKSTFENYHKKGEEKEIVSCDVTNNKCQVHKINIDQKNWFSSFAIHGNRLHAFVSTLDDKAKKANFWYAAYDLQNFEEVTPWQLLGKTDCKVKVIIWKRNNFLLKKSSNLSDDGTLAIAFYNDGTLGGNSGKTVGQTDGFVLTISKTGEILQKEKYDFAKTSEVKWGKKKLHQVFITNNNSVHLLHQHQQLTKKKIPRMDKARLSISSFNWNQKKEKTIVVGGDEKLFLDGLLSADKENNLFLCSIVCEELGKKRKLKSYFLLSKIDKERNVKELVTHNLNDEDDYYQNIYFPTVVHYSSYLKNTTDEKFILFFANKTITRDRQDFTNQKIWSESESKVKALRIDKSKKSIDWVTDNFSLNAEPSSCLNKSTNEKILFNDGQIQFQISAIGSISKIGESKDKSVKFKKKIKANLMKGHIENQKEVFIFGEDKNKNLYIGKTKN